MDIISRVILIVGEYLSRFRFFISFKVSFTLSDKRKAKLSFFLFRFKNTVILRVVDVV